MSPGCVHEQGKSNVQRTGVTVSCFFTFLVEQTSFIVTSAGCPALVHEAKQKPVRDKQTNKQTEQPLKMYSDWCMEIYNHEEIVKCQFPFPCNNFYSFSM